MAALRRLNVMKSLSSLVSRQLCVGEFESVVRQPVAFVACSGLDLHSFSLILFDCTAT